MNERSNSSGECGRNFCGLEGVTYVHPYVRQCARDQETVCPLPGDYVASYNSRKDLERLLSRAYGYLYCCHLIHRGQDWLPDIIVTVS